MENQENTQGAAPHEAAGNTQQSGQSLPDDLKKVADRAKNASQGFSFEKLFEGRIGQMQYIYAAVGLFVLGLVLGMIPLLGLIASLALAPVGFGVTARRLHDINITGWASLILFVPFVGLLAVLYLCWKEGDKAVNQFGAVADPKRDLFKTILNT